MILSCHQLSKSFGEKTIISQASFGIEEHEKAAIAGINGAGKSTLLKMIVGELAPDEGQVILTHQKTLGYLAQQEMLQGHLTIRGEMQDAKRDVIEAEQNIRALEVRMKKEHGAELEETMAQYHRLVTWFEQHDGYALESAITGVMKGLGFSEEEFDKKTDHLSGGQKTRVALGRLLLSEPDILLLDEPTNHLDMNSITWLENYLLNYKGAVLLVSHDRYFLNRIVTKVIEIDLGKVTTFPGNYTEYAQKKKMLREAQQKAWEKQQQEIRHQQEVITKLKSFNREKSIRRAESREKMLSHMEKLEKPAEADTQIHLSLEPRVISGKDVLTVENLSKSFGSQVLFSGQSFQIYRGERVALIGDNGTGKTTMLKIINGLADADEGTVSLGAKTMIGYYDQEHQVLHPEKTLFEELQDTWPEMNNTQVRNILAAFLFTGDDVFKRIKDLSGGERGRVSLAKLMLSKANFLLLDEPTNHLDIYSREILEDALQRYTGTVFYVSHDRYFINRTATRILELTGNTLINYIGNYDYYLEKKDELTGIALGDASRPQTQSEAPGGAVPSAKEQWISAREEQARQRKLQNDLRRLEETIADLEARDREIDEQLEQEEVFTDLEKCTALTGEKAEVSKKLELLYEKWEELSLRL